MRIESLMNISRRAAPLMETAARPTGREPPGSGVVELPDGALRENQ